MAMWHVLTFFWENVHLKRKERQDYCAGNVEQLHYDQSGKGDCDQLNEGVAEKLNSEEHDDESLVETLPKTEAKLLQIDKPPQLQRAVELWIRQALGLLDVFSVNLLV